MSHSASAMAEAERTLGALTRAVPGARLVGDARIVAAGIAFDSRQVKPGDLFVALPGTVVDGACYVPQAIERGAAAVVAERADAIPPGRSGLVVPGARLALGLVSAQLAGWPARELRVVGVTGTDGKTTTSRLITAILRAAGRPVGVITTVGAEIGDETVDTGFHTTTPDAPDLQRYLRRMVELGARDAVLEVTSHALVQERVAGCAFDLAVITNVTHDHFELHGSYEGYLAAKLRLFESLSHHPAKPGIPKGAVYNLDDPSAPYVEKLPIPNRLSYALEKRSDVRARGVRFHERGSAFEVETPLGSFSLEVPLPGWYNVANSLAAVAAGLLLDVPLSAIQAGIARFVGVSGRMERIDLGQPFEVFVDFAHTPNSLNLVLEMMRERGKRRVSVVFGCNGLRDRQKRPLMGEAAGRFADRIYLTAEDPRTEPLEQILEDIAAGCRKQNRREDSDFWRIPDRAEAIQRAIDEAEEGDIILVCGKGHERSMCIGTTEFPWSDQDVVRDALERRLGRERT
ncbi:MAG TPA: UDP-N-acetylmuramoyl-L-alanyl-D-glutamate--2,6-diaminopimelate ligase [Chloroflexota bacterium]|nr:UDP-N-acetylmuramoyl-L-alanyl-D-glutamate--2,6-diaminopimelate ligase [Chloroflexota bacterium]